MKRGTSSAQPPGPWFPPSSLGPPEGSRSWLTLGHASGRAAGPKLVPTASLNRTAKATFPRSPWAIVTGALVVLALVLSSAAAPLALTVRPGPHGVELSWPAVHPKADGRVERPWFELQRSTDLRAWEPLGERVRAGSTAPDEILTQRVSAPADLAFHRLLVVSPPRVSELGDGGAEVFGYADAFEEEFQRIGPISPEEFAARFALAPSYRGRLSWDPTTGNYWEAFNADPAVLNEGKEPGQPGYRQFDARLDAAELARFRQNGFVVSERLGSDSFAEAFFKLWHG